MTRLFVSGAMVLACLAGGGVVRADALDDLSSPDQTVRDRAAESLRAHPVVIPESKWKPIVDQLHKGQPLEEALALFPNDMKEMGGGGSGNTSGMSYALDSQWLLEISHTNEDGRVVGWSLSQACLPVVVRPPEGFTGTWRCYYPNGMLAWTEKYERGEEVEVVECTAEGQRASHRIGSLKGDEWESFGYDGSGNIWSHSTAKAGQALGQTDLLDRAGEVVDISVSLRGVSGYYTTDQMIVEARANLAAQQALERRVESQLAVARERVDAAPEAGKTEREQALQIVAKRLEAVRSGCSKKEESLKNLIAQKADEDKRGAPRQLR